MTDDKTQEPIECPDCGRPRTLKLDGCVGLDDCMNFMRLTRQRLESRLAEAKATNARLVSESFLHDEQLAEATAQLVESRSRCAESARREETWQRLNAIQQKQLAEATAKLEALQEERNRLHDDYWSRVAANTELTAKLEALTEHWKREGAVLKTRAYEAELKLEAAERELPHLREAARLLRTKRAFGIGADPSKEEQATYAAAYQAWQKADAEPVAATVETSHITHVATIAASLPTDPEDERIVDELMAKRSKSQRAGGMGPTEALRAEIVAALRKLAMFSDADTAPRHIAWQNLANELEKKC